MEAVVGVMALATGMELTGVALLGVVARPGRAAAWTAVGSTCLAEVEVEVRAVKGGACRSSSRHSHTPPVQGALRTRHK